MNEKQFTIIWIVALVIIILAGSGSIWYLQFDVLVEKRKLLEAVEAQVREARAKVAKIPELKKSIEKLKEREKELASFIPNLDRAEYDVFAELLDEMRRKANVTVPSVSWTTPSNPPPIPGRPPVVKPATIHKVQYDVAVSGSFYQLIRYINLLEQQRRFIGVETFSISKGGSTPTGPGVAKAAAPRRDLKITIYSYTYKPPDKPFELETAEERSGKSTDIPD